jgi:hypothetical protein
VVSRWLNPAEVLPPSIAISSRMWGDRLDYLSGAGNGDSRAPPMSSAEEPLPEAVE